MASREFYREGDGTVGSRFLLVHDPEHDALPVHILQVQTNEHDSTHATSESEFILSLPDFLLEKNPAQEALMRLIAELATDGT